MFQSLHDTDRVSSFQDQHDIKKLNGVSTIDFHITAKCRQVCPYCWGPRCFRNPVDTEITQRTITRIKGLGIRRIFFTGGDPLHRTDVPGLIRLQKRLDSRPPYPPRVTLSRLKFLKSSPPLGI